MALTPDRLTCMSHLDPFIVVRITCSLLSKVGMHIADLRPTVMSLKKQLGLFVLKTFCLTRYIVHIHGLIISVNLFCRKTSVILH